MKNKKDLGKLIAVDMPNGYTYIGFRSPKYKKPLTLNEVILVETEKITKNGGGYISGAMDCYKNTVGGNVKEEKIKIKIPGPIHYLKK